MCSMYASFTAPQQDNLKVAMDEIVKQILQTYLNQPQLGIPPQVLERVWGMYQQNVNSVRQKVLQSLPQTSGGVQASDLAQFLQQEVDETIRSVLQSGQGNQVFIGGATGGTIPTQQSAFGGGYHASFQTPQIQTPAWVAQQQRNQAPLSFGQPTQDAAATISADNSLAAKRAREAMLAQVQRQQTPTQPTHQPVVQQQVAEPVTEQATEPAQPKPDMRDLRAQPDPEVDCLALSDVAMQTVEQANYYTKDGLGIIGNVSVDCAPPWRDAESVVTDLLTNLPVLTKYDQWAHRIYYNEMRAARVPNDGVAATIEQLGEKLVAAISANNGLMPLDGVSNLVLPAFAHMTKLTGDYIEQSTLRVMNDMLFHHLRDPENPEMVIMLSSWSELPILTKPTQPAYKQIIDRLRNKYPEYDTIVAGCLSQAMLSLFGKAFSRVLNVEEHAAAMVTARGVNFRVGNYLPRDLGLVSEAMRSTFQDELRKYLVHTQTRMVMVTNCDPTGFANNGKVTVLRRYTHPMHKIIYDNLGALDTTLLFVKQYGSEVMVERRYRIGQTLDRTLLVFG